MSKLFLQNFLIPTIHILCDLEEEKGVDLDKNLCFLTVQGILQVKGCNCYISDSEVTDDIKKKKKALRWRVYLMLYIHITPHRKHPFEHNM